MLTDRIAEVKERIASACIRSGRSADSVQLVAVTKNHPRTVVQDAIEAGLRVFGENRVQEAVEKYRGLSEGPELHLIGHLQSNKARFVPGLFSWVESIDSVHIAEALSRRLVASESTCSVLLQYNSSGEETKSGFAEPSELLEAAERIQGLPGISVRGLMTIGPFTQDSARITGAFGSTRLLFDRVRAMLPGVAIDTLSMGMTDDLEIAISEGSTEVRIGTAIFGSRGE
ncbi:MAG: YggS family pyridoxal phosphate-dependent enzyme [Spirochaetales bacterium]|nr:YggS family pyridoxal phosphate-dependent enzyme [Spirochaetales bacterium]